MNNTLELKALIQLAIEESEKAAAKGDMEIADHYLSEAFDIMEKMSGANSQSLLQ